MTGGRKFVVMAAVAMLGAIVAGVIITTRTSAANSTSLVGAVLEAANDPRRQMPIGNAEVTATSAEASASTQSDASGQFRLTLTPAVTPAQGVTLNVRHAGYRPFEFTAPLKSEIYIAYLLPIHEAHTPAASNEVVIGDLRVRYSVKVSATINVGSFARTFEIAGSGGVPCAGASDCSPDGKWKAAKGSASYDAGEGNEFQEARLSCIAGPCAFTAIERDNFSSPGRTLKVSARDWSATATFLVEAEVMRTQINDIVRYSTPVVFANGMDFTLPGSAEGPSIEAAVNGADIVFPLGPDLFLSWGVCTLKTDKDGSKLYRCELKPGYRFR